MSKAEIIICTEGGYLESSSKCLVDSFRKFAGKYKDTPIISYQPRKDHRISRDTKKFFERNDVEIIDLNLNKNYCDYPLANKPLITAHRESVSSADILIFLDSDTFFINEPGELFDFEDAEAVLRPTDYKSLGTDNAGDRNNFYWDSLYKQLDVKIKRYTTTTVSNEKILEYYNTGHIAALTEKQLFQQWLINFNRIMETGLKPKNRIFIEQTVFSATVSQMELKVKQFSKGYNYPLSHKYKILNPDYFVKDPSHLVSIHYHRLFKRPLFHSSRTKKILNSEKGKEINEMLIKYGVKKQFSFFSKLKHLFYFKFKRKLNKLSKRL